MSSRDESLQDLQAVQADLRRYRVFAVFMACCSVVLLLSHVRIEARMPPSSVKTIWTTSLPRTLVDTRVNHTSESNQVEGTSSIEPQQVSQVPQVLQVPHKSKQKIIIFTVDFFSGGPEALFQLAFALSNRGFNVYRTTSLAPVLRPLYPDWEAVPSLPWDHIRDHLAPGDVVVVPEGIDLNSVPRMEGVRLVRWILAKVHSPVPRFMYLHHSFYLARANKSPASTVVMPYIHPNRTGFREGMYELATKRNTICIDNDAKAIAGLITNSGLRSRLNDDSLEVKVIEGMSFEQIQDLYRRCKVVIDKALPGMERVPLEAASFGAVVLLDDDPENSVGAEWLDFPIPAEYTGSWDVTRLESTLYKALTSYEQEMKKFEPLRHRIADMKTRFVDAVDRVFGQVATFLIPCTGPNDGANCLRAAISVLLISPLSMVRIITRDDEAAFKAANAGLYKVLDEAHMDGLVGAGPMDVAKHFGELVRGAPNHRVILMAADMVLIDGDELQSWSIHDSSSHEDCVLWVPSLDVDLPGEADLQGKICPTLETSFEDFSVVEDGHFADDPSHLHRFAHLCSSPIWRTAMQASSQSWLHFCASVERSSRS